MTGSAGKTTAKDAIAHLLAAGLPVGKTVGNLNNHVGVPLSILRLPDEARVGVLEMGMNHAGEIRTLAAIAKPDIGVVTNVGYAHVEAFDSIEGVALAKRELIEALDPRTGIAVLNADDPRVLRFREVHAGRAITFGLSPAADVRATDIVPAPDGTRFHVDGVPFHTTLAGRHGVLNLLAGMAVARAFDIPLERLRDAVASFTIGKMRGERLEHNGVGDLERLLQFQSRGRARHAGCAAIHARAPPYRGAGRDAGARTCRRIPAPAGGTLRGGKRPGRAGRGARRGALHGGRSCACGYAATFRAFF